MISTLEKEITFRYLKTRKNDGFLNIISIFSFIGISLGVAVLIIVMSVMNGFRTDLTNKILGLNPHIVINPSGSNINKDFKRIRIRNLLKSLAKEGLDKKKLKLTIDNLKDSDKSIKFYVNKNLEKNSVFLKDNNSYVLNHSFFDQSHEIIFRSLTIIIQKLGKKYYPVRGKSINKLIKGIETKSFSKVTLGGCFIDRINNTILISQEK